MAARYQQNYAAFGREVLRSEAMIANMRSRADRIKERFEATAPVGEPVEPDEHAGRYKGSARVESGTEVVEKGERAFGRVVVDDPAAMSIEYGHTATKKDGTRGKHVEGTHTLTNALDAAGDA